MILIDWLVLGGYFLLMAGIGVWSMRKVKGQEDYFMGGRGFGKILQTFAAFGAGKGSADPVNTARTTFTSGLSGMWSVMYWLFVTPIYWITGVWYRRMRHLTLGDWYVERYESRSLGAAYAVFGLLFYMVYTAMLFTAISKFCLPLLEGTVGVKAGGIGIEYILVAAIGLIIILYGGLGGLRAAYWTDLIQGLCIILLSVLLIPFGLQALVEKFGDPSSMGMMEGFRIMHEQLPKEHFSLLGTNSGSEFPLYRIMVIVMINLVGIVVMPHFIATGGGTAKSEMSARVGLVSGNLLKRFCTVGWALTALIAVALFAEESRLVTDPDQTWGLTSQRLLGPGLFGFMLACLLAALMSSADCYMLVCSALVVRNVYAAYINPNATEMQYVSVGRIAGAIMIFGAMAISWLMMDVFAQLQLTWIVPMLFAAPFWVGMFWRRATVAGAWATLGFVAMFFFIIPWLAPVFEPGLRTNERFVKTNHIVTTISQRIVSPSDAARRRAEIQQWQEAGGLGEPPAELKLGEKFEQRITTGGKSIFWSAGVEPVGEVRFEIVSETQVGDVVTITKRYACELKGKGNFSCDYLIYDILGIDLTNKPNAMLDTLSLPVKIVAPFLVMILVSLVTPRNSKRALDRYYVKMKTPVIPDPEIDKLELAESYRRPNRFDDRKLFRNSSLEFLKPKFIDVFGFILTLLACFAVIGLILWVAGIGSG